MTAPVDAAYANWLLSEALYRGWANSGLPGALAPMSVDSEIISPFATSTAVDTEIARQGVFLGRPLAMDQAIVKGKRVDLVGKCVTLLGDQLDYIQPAEKVTNGAFTSGTTGWSAANGATLSVVGGKLRVTCTGTLNPVGFQGIAAIPGKSYRYTVSAFTVTASPYWQITDPGVGILNSAWGNAGTFTGVVIAPPSGQIQFELYALTSTNGQVADYDDISLKEALDPTVLVIGAQEQDDGTTQLTVLRKL